MTSSRFFLVTAVWTFSLSAAEIVPTQIGRDFLSAIKNPRLEERLQKSLSILDKAKPEEIDDLLWAFDECTKDGIKPDFSVTLYWRKRARLEGLPLLERLVDGEWKARGLWPAVCEAVISESVFKQPAETEQWLLKHKYHPRFRSFLIASTSALGATDPVAGTKLLFALTDGGKARDFADSCGALCERIRNSWGSAYIVEWFDSLTPEQKAPAFTHAANRIKDAERSVASKWMAQQIGKNWYTSESPVFLYASAYIAASPEEAMNWVASLGTQKGKDFPTAIGESMEEWSQVDPIASGKWLQEHSDAKGWVRAAAGYYRGVRRKSASNSDQFLNALPKPLREKVEDMLADW
jgi:hypothetical protein